MSKRTLEEDSLVLCIAIEGSNTCVRRLFSTPKKAEDAEKKLVKAHGHRIATLIRSTTKQELLDMCEHINSKGNIEWLKTFDDDSPLPEVVDVSIGFMREGSDKVYTPYSYVVSHEYADAVCEKFAARVARMNAADTSKRHFVFHGEKRLALYGDKPDTDLEEEYKK